MTKQEYAEYVKAVNKELGGLTAISSGLCAGCGTCADAYDFDDEEAFSEAISNGNVCDEPSFSWSRCEVCGRPEGGDRYAVHAVGSGDTILHFDACVDCVYFIEYDKLDDTTMAEVEELTND